MKWVSTKLNCRVGWGRSYRKDKIERNITAIMFSVQLELSTCSIYPFLPRLLTIVLLSIRRREKKVTKTNLTFICTHMISAESITNTDIKEP